MNSTAGGGLLAGMMLMPPLPPILFTAPGTPNRRAALASIVSALELEVVQGKRTSPSAFILVAQSAAIYATDGTTFVNDLGFVLSGTSTTNVAAPRPGFRTPAFGDDGFRLMYQDQSNQVRHFVGAMVVGAAHGSASGQIANTGREAWALLFGGGGATVADVRMGNLAAHLGGQLAAGRISPSEFAEILRRELSP